ncbi:MAG: serine/threonine protein kinase [Thermogutta sp.]|nr:MAG: serine/threonine protein kinase [Thermogutta sp.]
MSRLGWIVASALLILGPWGLAGDLAREDWPQWRGPNRDGKIPVFQAPEGWPPSLSKKWEVAVGAGDATPALVEGRLYLHTRQGDEEVILCLDAESGQQIWATKYPSPPVTGPASRHPGPRSSPAVAEGTVVTLGVAGIVSCVDATSGKLLWQNKDFKGTPRFFTAMSPIIVDGLAVLQLGGPDSGTAVAFDLATGEIRWKWEGEAPSYASPVLLTFGNEKQIVTFTEQSLIGLSAKDGKLLWKVPFPASGRNYNAATPIADGQTIYFAGAGRGSRAIRVEKSGAEYVIRELWSNPDVAPQFNSPILKDGKLFGLSQRGNFYCLDAQTGKTLWMDDNSYTAFGALLDAGPVLLAMTERAGLIAFPPSGHGMHPVARYEVSSTPVYATPVVAGKRIYIKDAESLSLWTRP